LENFSTFYKVLEYLHLLAEVTTNETSHNNEAPKIKELKAPIPVQSSLSVYHQAI
jgi:hypothetical protein